MIEGIDGIDMIEGIGILSRPFGTLVSCCMGHGTAHSACTVLCMFSPVGAGRHGSFFWVVVVVEHSYA